MSEKLIFGFILVLAMGLSGCSETTWNGVKQTGHSVITQINKVDAWIQENMW